MRSISLSLLTKIHVQFSLQIYPDVSTILQLSTPVEVRSFLQNHRRRSAEERPRSVLSSQSILSHLSPLLNWILLIASPIAHKFDLIIILLELAFNDSLLYQRSPLRSAALGSSFLGRLSAFLIILMNMLISKIILLELAVIS